MLYALLQIFSLSLPGWLFVRLSSIQQNRFLFIVSFSYAYYTLIAATAIWQHWGNKTTLSLYLAGLGLLALLALKQARRATKNPPNNCTATEQHGVLLGGILVLLVYGLYRLWAGPYLEMPADVFHHLEYARSQLNHIQTGHLNGQRSLQSVLGQSAGIWYSLFAGLSHISGTEFVISLPWAMLINAGIFLTAIYAFSIFLFRRLGLTQNQQIFVSLLASFFVATHMGINVFSYIRYYAFAPTMLNMVLYFTSLICLYRLLDGTHKIRHLALFATFCLAATIIHNQEALFIGIMTVLILCIELIQKWFAQDRQQSTQAKLSKVFRSWPALFLLLALLTAIALEAWVYSHHARPTEWFNKVIQWSESGPITSRVLFLNPEYQFIRVVTLWGLFIYGLFIWQWKQFRTASYLLAGMLSPLLTVFNPLFVDFFLRLDGPHTLWRLLYLAPFHFVAAYLILRLIQQLQSNKRSWFAIPRIAALILIFALLFPLQIGPISNAYSRLTLKPVAQENSYLHWQDLISFLNQQSHPKNILTDPVTGYSIQGLTPHHTYRYKFSPTGSYHTYRFNFDDYTKQPLQQYKGWWVVINRRDGAHSSTGEMARHWPADIMRTSQYYSDALLQNLQTYPKRFRLLWAENQISVYEIRP